MYLFSDFLVLGCLFVNGLFIGYYYKFAYIYDNLWTHWYAVVGGVAALLLAGVWSFNKYRSKQYRFDNFFMIFYGLICSIISSCFMVTENVDISFYFGFVGAVIIFIPSFSFISLRSNERGLRPACIATGNTAYFSGLAIGFTVFNEIEPKLSAWLYLGMTLLIIVGLVANEVLQHYGVYNYKHSCDVAFNIMNEEKCLFLPPKSIFALFVGRDDFYFKRNLQWYVVAASIVLVLERTCVFSASFLQLAWSASSSYMGSQSLYGPFLLYSIGCGIGGLLLLRYTPKFIFLMFGMIKMTIIAAILGVYKEELTESCFVFICFYYISMGVYSSIALQMILECTPFLFTELVLAIFIALELFVSELLKYETKADNSTSLLIGMGISEMVLTLAAIVVVKVLLPKSTGLIDIRNKLLGIRKQKVLNEHSKIWYTNHFLQHNIQPEEVTKIKLDGNRIFQQYPKKDEN
ncbi:uncharacterized protein LOC119667214 [Teleopsis dalmanni]|uniref:uncharacterized protein LOC119667214 n=1 Tax=Teleopsis dalmanni TaxID=139649 RepID=UPI0018CFBFBA|nr:uncharacterized protein LOC119667214 [Teleopsis dalmanni]